MNPAGPSLSRDEAARLQRARWSLRVGIGSRPAVLVIDAQNYMMGRGPHDDANFPFSCGIAPWTALPRIKKLLTAARSSEVPIIYTRNIIDPTDPAYQKSPKKFDTPYCETFCFKGTYGAEIVELLAPANDDRIIDKKESSAFFGTSLKKDLDAFNADSVVIVGGATSNCVRATAQDAKAHGFRTVVARDGVFDRLEAAHQMSLSDIDRFLGDVMSVDEIRDALSRVQQA